MSEVIKVRSRVLSSSAQYVRSRALPSLSQVPRIFKLLHEEHCSSHDSVPEGANSRLIAAHKTFTGIGIDDEFLGDGDRPHSMSRWTGHIVDNTGARMWFVQIHCGPQYPAEPPSVKFTTKVNLEGVDQRTGLVDFARLARATSRDGFRWTEKSCIVEYLCAIRGQLLRDLGKPQPADGEHMKWPNT